MTAPVAAGRANRPVLLAERGLTLLEILVAVAIVGLVAVVAVPAYRDYLATGRDTVLANQINTMVVFQEDTRLRTGEYGAGEYDTARDVDSLSAAIGWAPSRDDGLRYAVTADAGRRWTVTATDANGYSMCQVFPVGEPCETP